MIDVPVWRPRSSRLADDVVLHEDTILDANRLTRLLSGARAWGLIGHLLAAGSMCGSAGSLTLRPTPR